MTIRTWLFVAAIWLVSLVAVGSLTYAQAPIPPANPPNIITGTDLGFVIEQQKGGLVFGQLMVRVDGQWRPVGGGGRGRVIPLGK
jgi:hypothetical protein